MAKRSPPSIAPMLEHLRERISNFPTQPGVYLMKNQGGKILYIGKAKSLRQRLRSYFVEDQSSLAPRTQYLMQLVYEVDYILTKTELEALLLEASLIKKHHPKYNVRLKDDKAYPYIRFSWSDDFPRLYISRKVKRDGSLYFGPYSSGLQVRETIRFLSRTFKIRDCTDVVFKSRKRPCMTYQIGRCTAPCVQLVQKDQYRSDVQGALDFLRGKNRKVLKDLFLRMKESSDQEHYEQAARWRDSISAIQAILEKQVVINTPQYQTRSSDSHLQLRPSSHFPHISSPPPQEGDYDVFAFWSPESSGSPQKLPKSNHKKSESDLMVEILHLRQGSLTGHQHHFLRDWELSNDLVVSFLTQYYEDNLIPDQVLLPVDLGKDLNRLLSQVLIERSQPPFKKTKISVRFPTDEVGRSLLQMAEANAKSQYERHQHQLHSKAEGLEEIQKRLELTNLPRRIEGYDISHLQGEHTVASQVVFLNGVPSQNDYRRYRLKSIQGINDYASMKEVLSRRLQHKEWDLPDLIVVDGGKGQLQVALRVLEELNLKEIPLVSLAKARTLGSFQETEVSSSEERFFLPGRQNPLVFRPNSEAYRILVGLRDEAHRFALSYHQKLRNP